jgi:hypothetical protein
VSDFRCEWQAWPVQRCSHQCNECKDNDTPPEPRMTSERQETEQAFERWYNHAFATRGVDTKHMNDCEDAFEAGRTLALRATPRAGSASKERGFFEWSCGCSLNNGLVTPCATHASPAAAPREHPSPEPYCASCDAREGEPCPHNVIQCARPRRAHPPRAVPDETRCEKCGLTQAGHILDGACLAFAHPTDRRYPCGCLIGARNGRVKLVEVCDVDRTADESHLPSPSAAHPPRAGDVTEEMVERALAYDASTWPSEKPWSEKAKADGRAYYRGLLTAALRGEAKG